MVEKVPDEHAQLWPYASNQLAIIPPLLARFNTWKEIINSLIVFFQLLQTTEKNLGKEHGRLFHKLEAHERTLGHGTADILKPWQHYLQFFESEYLASDTLISNAVLRRLMSLKVELKRKIKTYNTNVNKWRAGIIRDRNCTISSISTHEQNLAKRATAMKSVAPSRASSTTAASFNTPFGSNTSLSSSTACFVSDPWLSERVLYCHLHKMVVSENAFQENMMTLVRDMQVFDDQVVNELKTTMDEYAQARMTQWSAMQTHMASSRALATYVDTPSHFNAFKLNNHLNDGALWHTERTLDDFPYRVHEIQVIKHGLLYIPGRFSKNSWTPVVAVLTETGFFHCFRVSAKRGAQLLEQSRREAAADEAIGGGIDPSDGVVGGGAPTPARDVQPPASYWPASLFTLGRRYSVGGQKISSSIVNANEVAFQDIYNGLERPAAHISVSLSQSRTTIQHAAEKPNQCVFEVVVQHRRPRSGGPLGLWSKPPSDTWTRSEFKAPTERDLIEWLSSLQRKLQSYIPQGPPQPLFMSPNMIEQSVGALINERQECGPLSDGQVDRAVVPEHISRDRAWRNVRDSTVPLYTEHDDTLRHATSRVDANVSDHVPASATFPRKASDRDLYATSAMRKVHSQPHSTSHATLGGMNDDCNTDKQHDMAMDSFSPSASHIHGTSKISPSKSAHEDLHHSDETIRRGNTFVPPAHEQEEWAQTIPA